MYFINAHNGRQKPNLRRNKKDAKWASKPAGNSDS